MENNFAKNLKFVREQRKISQQELADKVGVDRSTIGYWENGKADPSMGNVCKLSDILNIPIVNLIGNDFSFDNAEMIDISYGRVQIPVLGTIKAGTPIEAQEDILDYVDIPEEWTKGDKKFFALKISGDSMYPKYKENDIVIFEQTEDYSIANKKDCAVMVNGYDATFKNVAIRENSITLIPWNVNNSDKYLATTYFADEIVSLPVKIIGIAREKREKID